MGWLSRCKPLLPHVSQFNAAEVACCMLHHDDLRFASV